MAGRAMLSKASGDMCSPGKPALMLNESNGILQDKIADCCRVSLQHCIPETDGSTPPETMPLHDRKLLNEDLNVDIALDTACMRGQDGLLLLTVNAAFAVHICKEKQPASFACLKRPFASS